MTLVVVVACKDIFYMMADTRTEDKDKGFFTDHTRKVFYSTKHGLGLCIADEAMLPDPSDQTNPDKTFSVSYIIDQFFTELDTKNIADVKNKIRSIDTFFILLQKFIRIKFGDGHLAVFQQNVSVFLACFINNQTVIGSYHGKKGQKVFEIFNHSTDLQNKLCAFSNYQSLIDNYSKQVINDPNCPIIGNSEIEKQNKLFSESNLQYRKIVLDAVVFMTRKAVLQQYPNSIGEYFEYIKIDQNTLSFRKLQHKSTTNNFVIVNNNEYFPEYIIVRTDREFTKKIESREIAAYDEFGGTYISIAATL